jgi:hypothetical protein
MMAARYVIGLALVMATVAWAEEPTFITKHGKVIPAPDQMSENGRVKPIRAAKPVRGGRQCIPIKSIKAESAETSASLIFHANDGSAYRNRLAAPCDGVMDVKQLCAGDAVWMQRSGVQSALGMGKDGDQETCKLGTFEKISEMSLSEFLRR